MSSTPGRERYEQLVDALCTVIDLPDPQAVLTTRMIEVEGFCVMLDHVESDDDAMYLQFDYGVPTAGRTLRIFRLMLESNLLVYAQDEAQLGVDPESGTALLVVRVPMHDDIDGAWLAETLAHYAEHGRYWRDNMLQSADEMFEGIASGDYQWLRA
jgi:Tir chaperone protein (CesT) family